MAEFNPQASKLNIGCGPDIREGFENIDRWEFDPRVVAIDLEKANLPYGDNTIDEIRATHVLEHIWNYIELLNECHRVLKKGCEMYIEVPYFPHPDSVKDPTHVRFFVPETFMYFTHYLDQGLFGMYKFKKWKLVHLAPSVGGEQICAILSPEKE